jgi:Tfp pilus assembly protein PilZ
MPQDRQDAALAGRRSLTSGRPRVDPSRVDVVTRFREYARLDRLRREGSLSLEELQRWQKLRRFLSIHFSPEHPEKVDDQRDSVRVPTRIKVSFAAGRELSHCMMTNISRGGLFVQTDYPLELKTTFTLVIHVESPPRELAVPVEVVSVGVGPAFARDKRGMGLRFLEMSPAIEKQLRELYENAIG